MKFTLANFQTLLLKDAARQFLADFGYKSEKLPNGAAPDSFNLLPNASLPGQIFDSTQIPVCLGFLAKNKTLTPNAPCPATATQPT